MKHYALPRFWDRYRELPPAIRRLADKNYKILKSNPTHPSLHFKKIGNEKHLWSVRIGIGYRALGVEKANGIYWFWIGSHAEYDRLIS
jgi:mRNA-degrading endonuclease RelE of RelBE toxin-antitoxin system